MAPALMLFVAAFFGAAFGFLSELSSTTMWVVSVVVGLRLATWNTPRWLAVRGGLLLALAFMSAWAASRHRVEVHQRQLAELPFLEELVDAVWGKSA